MDADEMKYLSSIQADKHTVDGQASMEDEVALEGDTNDAVAPGTPSSVSSHEIEDPFIARGIDIFGEGFDAPIPAPQPPRASYVPAPPPPPPDFCLGVDKMNHGDPKHIFRLPILEIALWRQQVLQNIEDIKTTLQEKIAEDSTLESLRLHVQTCRKLARRSRQEQELKWQKMQAEYAKSLTKINDSKLVKK